MALKLLENLDLFTSRSSDGNAHADISQRCTRKRIPVCIPQHRRAASRPAVRSGDEMTPITEQFIFSFDTATATASNSAASIATTPIGPSKARGCPSPATLPGKTSRARRACTSRLDDLEPPADADRPACVHGCVTWLSERFALCHRLQPT